MLRIILFPISLLYGIILYIRNLLFDWRILPSGSFDFPVISVGNLSMGGTGKTPHVEYLIRLLAKEKFTPDTLSRGYKRKTKGFILADVNSNANDIGDEPVLFKSKFPDVAVAVDKNRRHGIEMLMKLVPETDVVVLDDAFQHRYVRPGLSILITDFYKLYTEDHVFPTGTLREFRTGANRADIIVVSKSPRVLSPFDRRAITDAIKPQANQKIYFSYLRHGNLTRIHELDFTPGKRSNYSAALLVSGIANPYPLERYLKEKINKVDIMAFPDHHFFTVNDIDKITERFDRIFTKNKIIVTTEKDLMRLKQPELITKLRAFPLCYVPIRVKFHEHEGELFDQQIIDYVRKNRRNHSLHKRQN